LFYARQAYRRARCDIPPPEGGKGTLYCLKLAHEIEQLDAELTQLEEELKDAQNKLAKCESGESESNSLLGGNANTSSTGDSVRATICPVFSWDPNDKVGPAGTGSDRFVDPTLPVPYTIYFENESKATAPARDIIITDHLDPNLDITSFALGTMRFGDHTVPVPTEAQDFASTEDLRPTNDLLVQIEAHLDPKGRVATWKFTSLDSKTGLPPTDLRTGFLPPNNIPPEGEGTVSFSIGPAQGLLTGQPISNEAQVVFDANSAINTPIWTNTIDSAPPQSHVMPLASTQTSPSFTVQWSGTDTGSGIHSYTIYASDNGSPFVPWQVDTTSTQAAFPGIAGHTYRFYSVGKDEVGNVESLKTTVEATTQVIAACHPKIVVTRTGAITRDENNNLVVNLSLTNIGGSIAKKTLIAIARIDTISATVVPGEVNIAAKCSIPVQLRFPESAAHPGSAVLKIAGSYVGGSFNFTSRITLRCSRRKAH
jgi:hypothetical protein